MLKVVLIGCVEFSQSCLRHAMQLEHLRIVGVVTRRHSSFNSDFCTLEPIAAQYDIPIFIAQRNEQDEMVNWIEELKPDIIFCFGWSYLLNNRILKCARLGVVGYHPASLPRNRGRHPVIWTLALGLNTTASTFFFMDEGADSGDILDQRAVAVSRDDDARTLYDKLTKIALEQITDFSKKMDLGIIPRMQQNHTCANVWRKRSKLDGQIDWRMSAEGIYNLVRALTRPYPGAHFVWRGAEIKIWRCRTEREVFRNLEPGKVIATDQNSFQVKCGDDSLWIVDHETPQLPEVGTYL